MLISLQTSFGSPIGQDLMSQLASEKDYDMVRLDGQSCTDEQAVQMVEEAVNAGLYFLFMIGDDDDRMRLLPPGSYVTKWNETNIGLGRPAPMPASEYAEGFKRAREAADKYGMILGGPVVSNIDRRGGFKYIEDVIAACGGEFIGDFLDIHRYPTNNLLGNPDMRQPAKGWRSRDEEVEGLKSLIGDKPFGVSETGFPTSFYRRYGIFPARITEDMALAELKIDRDFWNRHGAAYWTQYQLNDGPTLESIDQFGIRTFPDYQWKKTSTIGQ